MTASVAYCIYATDCGYGFVLEYKVLHLENKQLKTNNNMKKIFNWVLAAILVCGASVVMSSCSKDDDSDNSSTPQSKKYDVYASAVLDKNLAEYGYSKMMTIDEKLDLLASRMSCGSFPHEIGAFLGYPVGDIRGFISNSGKNCLLCGYWKVYENAEKAQRTFDEYDRCRDILFDRLNHGLSLFQAVK